MPNSECERIRAEYENLKTLKQEFDLEYQKQKELKTKNLEKIKKLQALIEQKRDALNKQLWRRFNPRTLKSVEYKEDYTLVKTLKEHNDAVYTLQVTPDGSVFAGGTDKTIKIWDGKPAKRSI